MCLPLGTVVPVTRVVASMTLSQGVAEHLRDLIHRGEMGPGDRLPPEREFAERLGVARISLREAIKSLQLDGYVQVRRGPRGGTFVTELRRPAAAWRARMREQAGEIDAIIDYRIALETHTARLAAQRRGGSDLEAMRDAIRTLDGTGGRSAFRLADSRFHGAVARAAGNTRLESAVHAARGELFSPYDGLEFVEPVAENRLDHQAVFEAICDGDAEASAELMREHLERAREQLREIVFGRAARAAGSA